MIILYSTNINNNIIELDGNESHHCISVMRKKVNDQVKVLDGKGNCYDTIVISENKGKVLLKIKDVIHYNHVNPRLHIAIAPTKSQDRIEWFIEKTVEIGISEITFLKTNRTERKRINYERCIKISISAMKQSGQFYLPTINNIINYDTFIGDCQEETLFIGSLDNDKLKTYFSNSYAKGTDCCFIIGPEGDFTDNEMEQAVKNNFMPISLGNSVLRTESAGVFVASAYKILNESE